MSIKCGKCKEQHETVNEVRNCYLGTNFRPDARANGLPPEGAAFLSDEPTPKRPGAQVYRELAGQLPDLERARYAIDIDDTVKFYQIDKPSEGKWAGYTFIKVQASDETYPVKDMTARIRIIETILEDPAEAMLRYGREIGHCGHCGRTLTNEESRAYGIGPVCRAKGEMGWLR